MIIHPLVQGSDEWAAFRLAHHGASEAAAMLGLSPNKTTRAELLHMKYTGTPKQFSEWVQKNILDKGHEVEAMARPIIEEMIGEDLYPVTCSNGDTGGKLSASCDGLTMDYGTAFEHKQYNAGLFESVKAGVLPDEHMPQCQQIMLVTGARRVIFVVSDGTPENCAHLEVRPDPAWFARIKAGWEQFGRDLAEYVPPETSPAIVAEAVQALPAVSVQVSGEIVVRNNFDVFETALRDFLENRLIRAPQTDQDFADLDLQIKAMKRAEETLDAAEAQMLAQIQSVDEAKRQKDMLAKLVRDNRLMAEKLLASEKERRRAERVSAARKAFCDHVASLQREIAGVRLDAAIPDFTGVIKGLKTLASIGDRLDTALANGRIAADQQAADLRAKLAWLDANGGNEHRALLADLQALVAKPFDDFKLVVQTRINKHRRDEAARLEAERARIRAEEAARVEREAQQRQARDAAIAVQQCLPGTEEDGAIGAAQARADAVIGNNSPDSLAGRFPGNAGEPVFIDTILSATEPVTARADGAGHSRPPTLRLGQINERLAPISLTADGLASLGFPHAATDKAAKLYHERDFPRICAALVQHVQRLSRSECRAPEEAFA